MIGLGSEKNIYSLFKTSFLSLQVKRYKIALVFQVSPKTIFVNFMCALDNHIFLHIILSMGNHIQNLQVIKGLNKGNKDCSDLPGVTPNSIYVDGSPNGLLTAKFHTYISYMCFPQ